MATILYIEDYPAAAMTMEFLLQEFGHQCIGAANGGEALEKYRTGAYDLVLIDNKLPDMTGAQVALAMRGIEGELGRAPGVLIGYSAGSANAKEYDGARMDGFEMKSLSMAHLEAMLNKYLKTG